MNDLQIDGEFVPAKTDSHLDSDLINRSSKRYEESRCSPQIYFDN